MLKDTTGKILKDIWLVLIIDILSVTYTTGALYAPDKHTTHWSLVLAFDFQTGKHLLIWKPTLSCNKNKSIMEKMCDAVAEWQVSLNLQHLVNKV